MSEEQLKADKEVIVRGQLMRTTGRVARSTDLKKKPLYEVTPTISEGEPILLWVPLTEIYIVE